MLESFSRIRRSVRRVGAEKYLLLMLISFAASVSFTRAFLNLTGFPQLGSGSLHIAHVLWGGLFLYAAAVLPLIYANRWVYPAGALLAGIGVGLFMDEVGKFITSTNDYFFPPAAPIIYSFFVIAVLIYLRVSRQRSIDDRVKLYSAFDMMEEVLEHELDSEEKAELVANLQSIKDASPDLQYRRLADEMLHFVASETLEVIPRRYFFTDRVSALWFRFSLRWISKTSLYWFITITVFLMSASLLSYPISFITGFINARVDPQDLMAFLQGILVAKNLNLQWLTARLVIESLSGFILLVSSFLLIIKNEANGIVLAYLGIILVLTTVNLLLFYIEQFSTIFFVMMQVVIFLAIRYYRNKYLSKQL